MTESEDYLHTLHPQILTELATIARTAIGMSDEEKSHARLLFGSIPLSVALGGDDALVPAASMVGCLGMVVTVADALACPDEAVV
jgi:hypothetical protein